MRDKRLSAYIQQKNWNLTPISSLVKCRFVQRGRLAGKKLFLATAASRRATDLLSTHAVGGVAVRANNVKWVGHGLQLGDFGRHFKRWAGLEMSASVPFVSG